MTVDLSLRMSRPVRASPALQVAICLPTKHRLLRRKTSACPARWTWKTLQSGTVATPRTRWRTCWSPSRDLSFGQRSRCPTSGKATPTSWPSVEQDRLSRKKLVRGPPRTVSHRDSSWSARLPWSTPSLRKLVYRHSRRQIRRRPLQPVPRPLLRFHGHKVLAHCLPAR